MGSATNSHTDSGYTIECGSYTTMDEHEQLDLASERRTNQVACRYVDPRPNNTTDSAIGPSLSKSPMRIHGRASRCDSVLDARPKIVDLGYGDFDLQIDDTVFKTHRHHLVKFGSFAGRIRRAFSRDAGIESIRIDGDGQDVDDMANAFKIIYASVISGPLKFEPQVLISALRVAKTYGYPELRTYCIEQLEESEGDFSPVQCIEFARAFDPGSQEVATYDEMRKRDKPITEDETMALGLLAAQRISRVREQEKAEDLLKGKNILPCGYDAFKAREPEPPNVREEECGYGRLEEVRKQQEKKDKEYRKAWRRQEVLEQMEMEERRRGYEESLRQHQEQKRKEELKVKGRIEEPSRREQENRLKGKGYGRQEEQEHEWKGQEQDWKVGETSNLPIKGKNNGASRAFSAFSSRYLTMAGRICGKSKAPMDSPKPGGTYTSDAKDDSTLFDEYVDDFKSDSNSELHEKKLSI